MKAENSFYILLSFTCLFHLISCGKPYHACRSNPARLGSPIRPILPQLL
jgi:hypothetical protein